MACDSCGAKRGHLNGCPELEGRQGRRQLGSKPPRGGKAPNCPICGKTMTKFENPARYLCTTSRKEHLGIIAAAEASERGQRGRDGIGNRSLRDKDRERRANLKGRTRGGGRNKNQEEK